MYDINLQFIYCRTKADCWSVVGGGATAARCYHFITVSTLHLRSHRSPAVRGHLANQVRPTPGSQGPAIRLEIREAGILRR